MKYIAYGSNMNIEQMKRRCPKALPIGKAILENYKLVFKGVADIIKRENETVPVAVWEITDECERALDRYEGYPTLYRKEYVKLIVNGKEETAMVYVMNREGIAPPGQHYYDVIEQGYKDFMVNVKPLERALVESIKAVRK